MNIKDRLAFSNDKLHFSKQIYTEWTVWLFLKGCLVKWLSVSRTLSGMTSVLARSLEKKSDVFLQASLMLASGIVYIFVVAL